MNTLYLTPNEQQLFKALSADLREGWTIEAETHGYADSPERRDLRLALVRIHDPKLVAFRDQVQRAQTIEEVAQLVHLEDLKDVDSDDMASLFFALGPDFLSHLISTLLKSAASDTDIEGVTALTVIRHEILQSFLAVSRSR